MSEILILLRRELKNSFNKRMFLMLVFMLLFQFWFIMGSGSIGRVETLGIMDYMTVVFSFNFFGSIVALALNHDGISIERESKFLDLILTSGISKKKVYISKILTSFLISGIFASFYILFLMLIYLAMSGDVGLGLLTLKYLFPLTAFLSIFSLLGLMLSVIFRSSKTSLIASVIIGGLLMPRILVMIIDSLSTLFGFSDKIAENLYMISPALIMNALNGYSTMLQVLWALFLLVIYIIANTIWGMHIFVRQDELNYGE